MYLLRPLQVLGHLLWLVSDSHLDMYLLRPLQVLGHHLLPVSDYHPDMYLLLHASMRPWPRQIMSVANVKMLQGLQSQQDVPEQAGAAAAVNPRDDPPVEN